MKLTETIQAPMMLVEREENQPRRIKANQVITADVVNGNMRRYPASVVQAAIDDLRNHLHESAGQGRIAQILGEAEHPTDKGAKRASLLETVVRWTDVQFDGSSVSLGGNILETQKGRDLLALLEGGVYPGVSLRGHGETKNIKENGQRIEEVTSLSLTGFDLVLEPSFNQAQAVLESVQSSQSEDEMSEELEKKLQESETAKADLLKKLEESKAAYAELAEMKRKSAVETAIAEATKDLPYGEKNALFVEAIKAANPQDAVTVKSLVEAKRKEYDALFSEKQLAAMGYKAGKISEVKPVLESETGTPEFARASFEITESVRKHEMRLPSDLRKNESRAGIFTTQLLERFDKLYMQKLLAEARIFQEAETASDLSLPYSVSRAIIAEAFPNLVAANVFDVGLMNQSPENIYYEAFVGESGYTVVITNEVVTMGAESTWYSLAHNRVTPGTVTVTENPAGSTWVEGTDYIIDYELGKIKALAAGSINTDDVLVTYTYSAIRLGENVGIERAKTTLSYQTITAAADRLADYITSEAIVFSRSQLGWDAVGRTMANIVRQTRLNIEKGLTEKALGAALSVASNSGGTWTSATDPWALLVEYLGYAKVKVAKRFYEPTSILMSPTNADMLSNWDGFTRSGFPNAILTAAGFAGGVKGLPVFTSNQMRDGWALVMNREIVMHRVFQPMTIKGPFQTFDAAYKLVAAEQYYSEEYNASLAPVPGKAAYVKIV